MTLREIKRLYDPIFTEIIKDVNLWNKFEKERNAYFSYARIPLQWDRQTKVQRISSLKWYQDWAVANMPEWAHAQSWYTPKQVLSRGTLIEFGSDNV